MARRVIKDQILLMRIKVEIKINMKTKIIRMETRKQVLFEQEHQHDFKELNQFLFQKTWTILLTVMTNMANKQMTN